MTKERVLESQDIRTVCESAEIRRVIDPYDWPWAFFVIIVYGAIGLCIALLMGWV